MTSKVTPKEIRVWALVMTAVLAAIGVVQYLVWSHTRAASIFWIIAALFFLPGLLFPLALKPVYRLWLILAAGLAWFNTRLILSLTFFLIFTPLGIILKLLGKDLIKEKWDRQAASYWIERPDEPLDPSRYEKQF
jgi:hypothetical protein